MSYYDPYTSIVDRLTKYGLDAPLNGEKLDHSMIKIDKAIEWFESELMRLSVLEERAYNGYLDRQEVNVQSIPRCECGKEKHGFMAHSPWCNIK